MALADATYPGAVKIFTEKENEIDVYDAEHINSPQDEIIALQTYTGVNPHGDRASVAERLTAMLNGSGYLYSTAGVPVDTHPGRMYLDSDGDTVKIAKSDGSGYKDVAESFSNCIFSFSGCITNSPTGGAVKACMFNTASLTPPYAADIYSFWAGEGLPNMPEVIATKFQKISGVQTVTIKANCWNEAAGSALVNVAIGAVSGSVKGAAGRTVPEEVTMALDVSGLDNGTFYDVSITLSSTGTNNMGYLSSIIGIGS